MSMAGFYASELYPWTYRIHNLNTGGSLALPVEVNRLETPAVVELL